MMVFKLVLSLIAGLLLASLGSCVMNEGSIGSPRKSDSPSHEQNKSFEINLQKAWEDKIIGLDRHLKDYPLEKLLALESLLAQVPEEQVKSEFERIARVPVGYSDMNEYE
jgi:hypothetical protein